MLYALAWFHKVVIYNDLHFTTVASSTLRERVSVTFTFEKFLNM